MLMDVWYNEKQHHGPPTYQAFPTPNLEAPLSAPLCRLQSELEEDRAHRRGLQDYSVVSCWTLAPRTCDHAQQACALLSACAWTLAAHALPWQRAK